MNPETKKNAAWYALRRTLPPWKFEENLSELLLCARKYRIDEVVIKVDTEEFHHGHGIQEWLRAYQPKLRLAREALNDIGVEYSLNPWITLGHAERGRDSIAQLPGLQTVVAFDGKQGRNRACPLSPVWRFPGRRYPACGSASSVSSTRIIRVCIPSASPMSFRT